MFLKGTDTSFDHRGDAFWERVFELLLFAMKSLNEMTTIFEESLDFFENRVEWFGCSGLKLMAVVGEELRVDSVCFRK